MYAIWPPVVRLFPSLRIPSSSALSPSQLYKPAAKIGQSHAVNYSQFSCNLTIARRQLRTKLKLNQCLPLSLRFGSASPSRHPRPGARTRLLCSFCSAAPSQSISGWIIKRVNVTAAPEYVTRRLLSLRNFLTSTLWPLWRLLALNFDVSNNRNTSPRLFQAGQHTPSYRGDANAR